MSLFYKSLPKYIRGDKVVSCIAGLNVFVTENGQAKNVRNPIDKLIDEVRMGIKNSIGYTTFVSFVAKQYHNQRRLSSIVSDNSKVKGLMFIPNYESTDGKNHLLVVLGNDSSKLKEAFQIK